MMFDQLKNAWKVGAVADCARSVVPKRTQREGGHSPLPFLGMPPLPHHAVWAG